MKDIEWYTGYFSDINWDAMHHIVIDEKGISAWKELITTKPNDSLKYHIKYMHAYHSSNNMQKNVNLLTHDTIRQGEDAKLEICEGLYHGIINGNKEQYLEITEKLFLSQPMIKKTFFEVVFS